MTRPFPGFERLYELHDPVASRPFRAAFAHDAEFELSRGETTAAQPVRVTWAMASADPSDVIWTTSAHPLIVSSRVVEVLNANKVTGWTTYPVEVFNKRGSARPGYVGVAVVGRCGRINLAKSSITLRRYPGGHFPHFVGHFFDPSSWDGSDFCTDVPDKRGNSSMTRIVTEEVVTLFKRHGISNVRFERLTEVSVLTSVFEVALGYLLPRDFKRRVSAAYRAAALTVPKAYR